MKWYLVLTFKVGGAKINVGGAKLNVGGAAAPPTVGIGNSAPASS